MDDIKSILWIVGIVGSAMATFVMMKYRGEANEKKIEDLENIVSSKMDEFKKKKLSVDELIIISYRALLDREPDKDGLEYWKNKLDGSLTIDKMLDIFLNSKEFTTLVQKGFVNQL